MLFWSREGGANAEGISLQTSIHEFEVNTVTLRFTVRYFTMFAAFTVTYSQLSERMATERGQFIFMGTKGIARGEKLPGEREGTFHLAESEILGFAPEVGEDVEYWSVSAGRWQCAKACVGS